MVFSHPPTPKQTAELEAEHERLILRAAAVLAEAEVLVLLTGAGWRATPGVL